VEATSGASILFFDLDGPILDVSPRYVALHEALLEEFGARGMEASLYWRRKRAVCLEEAILTELGVGERAAEYVRRRLELIETRPFLACDRPWPWVVAVLDSLVKRHSLVLVTARAQRGALMDQLTRLELRRFFQEVLSSPAGSNVGQQKAALISDYIRGLQPPPGEHWMIGDTEADVDSGKRLGLQTVAVLSGIRDEEHLRAAGPDFLLNDIRELSFVLEKNCTAPGVVS
jgi:phosphoglycolate phosphatase-like HAD superfamily hydrolase